MFKLIGWKRPKANPHAFIVVTERGAHWANEHGAITGPVATGTIQRVAESGSAFGEAALLASLALAHVDRIEARLTERLAQLSTTLSEQRGERPNSPRPLQSRLR
jgi:hypothetical protein